MPTGIYIHKKGQGGRKGRTGKYKRTEETKERMRESKLGVKNPMFGKTYTTEERQKISERMKGKLPKNWQNLNKSLGGLNSIRKLSLRKPTSIEIKVYNKLKEMGILFEAQKVINGKFCVDAYIPSLNLVIEADGNYWHKLDNIVKKDRAENAYLTKCGYNILRLSETEINNTNFGERIG